LKVWTRSASSPPRVEVETRAERQAVDGPEHEAAQRVERAEGQEQRRQHEPRQEASDDGSNPPVVGRQEPASAPDFVAVVDDRDREPGVAGYRCARLRGLHEILQQRLLVERRGAPELAERVEPRSGGMHVAVIVLVEARAHDHGVVERAPRRRAQDRRDGDLALRVDRGHDEARDQLVALVGGLRALALEIAGQKHEADAEHQGVDQRNRCQDPPSKGELHAVAVACLSVAPALRARQATATA
jgi:hypothetical protein